LNKPRRYDIVIAVFFIAVSVYLIFMPSFFSMFSFHDMSLFRGYRTQTIRVDSKDLSILADTALKQGYNVEVGDKYNDDEYYKVNSFLGGGRFSLSYGVGTDSTHYHFTYLSNETGRLNLFWERFGYYFNISDFWVNQEKNSVRYDDDASGKHFGSYIEGKPVWSRVVEDAGEEKFRDDSRVGVLEIQYGSSGELSLRTKYLQISKSVNVDGVETTCVLMIDEDSDILLKIECKQKIKNPIDIFDSMFRDLNLPISITNNFKFNEIYGAYA